MSLPETALSGEQVRGLCGGPPWAGLQGAGLDMEAGARSLQQTGEETLRWGQPSRQTGGGHMGHFRVTQGQGGWWGGGHSPDPLSVMGADPPDTLGDRPPALRKPCQHVKGHPNPPQTFIHSECRPGGRAVET